VEINAKDLRDAALLLSTFPIGDRDGEAINGARVAELCAEEWGLWRTLTQNLDKVKSAVAELPAQEIASVVPSRVAELEDLIDRAPKSRRWRMRAAIGERKRWYELPEEVAR
jgi:hypothetical protein